MHYIGQHTVQIDDELHTGFSIQWASNVNVKDPPKACINGYVGLVPRLSPQKWGLPGRREPEDRTRLGLRGVTSAGVVWHIKFVIIVNL